MNKVKYIYKRVQNEYCRRKFLKSNKEEINKSENDLVFIISSGRSGSTLLRRLMVENIQIHIPPESSEFIVNVAKQYNSSNEWGKTVEDSILLYQKLNLNQFWNLDIKSVRNGLEKVKKNKRSLKYLIYYLYKSQSIKANNESKILGDKSPILSLHLDWITTLYPNAKYIHLIRDPYDVTYSRMINFNESIEQASYRWLWTENEFKKYKSRINFVEIEYAQLTRNSEKILGMIANFLQVNLKSIKDKNLIHLGDDSLTWHRQLHNVIVHKSNQKEEVFSKKQIEYLNRKFKS